MSAPAAEVRCPICHADASQPGAREPASVHSNVREFSHESFEVWRCLGCDSIHAADEVDLAHYYARYPFHELPTDWRTRAMLRNQHKRLRAAGVQPQDRILDYGCGSGLLIRYLQSLGYAHAVGYDEYSEQYGDDAVLQQQYDCVISQDVIEHVADPLGLLKRFDRLAKAGGVVAIGTPNASAIELDRAQDYAHTLHQPYHRHIFSKDALIAAGEKLGWTLERYYPTMYANTRVPFVNLPFVKFYARLYDDSLDVLLEPPKLRRPLLYAPRTLWIGLFGSFFCPETDVMAVFRTAR